MKKKKTRKEKDFLGTLTIPADAPWGINTQRALGNFRISGMRCHPGLIDALLEIKLSDAMLFKTTGLLDRKICNAIIEACRGILKDPERHRMFPVDVFQAGAGTSLNMNANEVIANRANELLGGRKGEYSPVHPNDHVNKAQSTNDVFPSAMRIAAIREAQQLVAAVRDVSAAFLAKSKEFRECVKSGRTHLNDATPVTLGKEFGAYAQALKKEAAAIEKSLANLHELGIGGTATGSGLTAPEIYRKNVVKYIAKTTGLRLRRNGNSYEAMENQADFALLMGAVKSLALNLIRISNDLRLLASGPNTGLNEIVLPAVQPGSSIMPGKVNPSILEMVTMVSFYACGMEETVGMAVQAGQLELNVMMPLIAHGTLTALDYLKNAVVTMKGKCIKGIKANRDVLKAYAENSLGVATILNPYIGYERTAQIVLEAKKTGRPVMDIIREQKILSDRQIADIIRKSVR